MEAKKNPKYDIDRRRPLFFFIGLTISLLLVIIAFEWKTEDKQSQVEIVGGLNDTEIIEVISTQQPPPPPPKKPRLMTVTEVSVTEDLSEEIEINTDMEVTEDMAFEPVTFSNEQETEEEVEDEVFMIVESMPKPLGGYDAFYEFVSNNLRYPRSATRNGVQGKIFIQFVITKDGKMSDTKVVKGLGFGCDEEALRVVNIGFDWIPGEQRGKPVNVRMILPIYFKLAS